jgi:hypothetical protein
MDFLNERSALVDSERVDINVLKIRKAGSSQERFQ